MSDAKILQLQKDLVTLGFDPGDLDGFWGSRTKGACHDLVEEAQLTLTVTSPPTDTFIDYVHKMGEAARHPAPGQMTQPPADYHDISAQASAEPRKGPRPWAQVIGATLHQTGAPMGESPSRWYGLHAHYGVTYSGQLYRVHPEEQMIWHAQGQSHGNVGIEISGFFCGVEGDKATRPGGPPEWGIQSVTAAQIAAVKELLRYLKRLLQSHGSDLKLIQPHRLATDDRRPDPGSKVWQQIGMPMIEELKCSFGAVTGKGMPLPELWDASQKGVKY